MKPGKVIGGAAGGVMVALSLATAGIVYAYLTEYGESRLTVAALVVAVGIGIAAAIYLLASKYCRSTRSAIIILSLLAAMLLIPLLSMVYPGRVTYARFGLTVYGIIPVPVLDITVGSNGMLWFRDKSHFISASEVQPLLSPEVKVLVIGTGWNNVLKVDPAILDIEGVEVHILPTPAAIDLFNRCVSEGRKVVLVAHSTC